MRAALGQDKTLYRLAQILRIKKTLREQRLKNRAIPAAEM